MSIPTTALELRLIALQTMYKVDSGGRAPAEFRQHIEHLQQRLKSRQLTDAVTFPDPPAVDLQLEIHNHGPQETTIWLGGDDSLLSLELAGPGALCIASGRPIPAMYTPSSPIKLPAGGRHVLPLRQLAHGISGCSEYSYWTEPGRYTLTARLRLGAEVQGAAGLELVSNPVTLEVQ